MHIPTSSSIYRAAYFCPSLPAHDPHFKNCGQFVVFVPFVWPDFATAQSFTATKTANPPIPILARLQQASPPHVSDWAAIARHHHHPAPSQPPPPLPVIYPSKELEGLAIVSALKKDGGNLSARHGSATEGQGVQTMLQTPH
jgi:hypothetical protein